MSKVPSATALRTILENQLLIRCSIAGTPGSDEGWASQVTIWTSDYKEKGEIFYLHSNISEPTSEIKFDFDRYDKAHFLHDDDGGVREESAPDKRRVFTAYALPGSPDTFTLFDDGYELTVCGGRIGVEKLLADPRLAGSASAQHAVHYLDSALFDSESGGNSGNSDAPIEIPMSTFTLMMHYARLHERLRMELTSFNCGAQPEWRWVFENLAIIYRRFGAFLEQRRKEWLRIGTL